MHYHTWVRGSAATMDDWVEFGGKNWSWDKTKDYFNKSATYHDDGGLYPKELFKIGNHGGPLHISHAELMPENKPFGMPCRRRGLTRDRS